MTTATIKVFGPYPNGSVSCFAQAETKQGVIDALSSHGATEDRISFGRVGRFGGAYLTGWSGAYKYTVAA